MTTTIKTLGLASLLIGILACISFTEKEKKTKEQPNIIFFLVDDMGWMDTSINGSEYYETPNMERLAKMGMKFTQAYAANPLCSPTRSSILTGQDPARVRITMPGGHLPPNPDKDLSAKKGAPWQKMATPTSRTFLTTDQFTIAEALKENGYTTAHIGKWHLGQKGYWPEDHGFDVNIGGQQHPGPPHPEASLHGAHYPAPLRHRYTRGPGVVDVYQCTIIR